MLYEVITNGKLEGMTKPIPPEHMYDMWVQKSNYLDKLNMQNISKGKKIEGYLRVNYDLSVIISKYDDYLKWLDRITSYNVCYTKLLRCLCLYKSYNLSNRKFKLASFTSVFHCLSSRSITSLTASHNASQSSALDFVKIILA